MAMKRKDRPKKIFDLKEWLDLDESAQYLSKISGEEVSAADVLKLALNGHLKISVKTNLENIPVRRCRKSIEDLGSAPAAYSLDFPGWVGARLDPEDKVCHLDEQFYDLPMIGAEKRVVYNKWEEMNGSPAQAWIYCVETVLQDESGELYILQSKYFENDFICSGRDEYRSANGLPPGSEIVVRTEALSAFARKCLGLKKAPREMDNESNQDIDAEIDNTHTSSANPGEILQLSENKKNSNSYIKTKNCENEEIQSEDVDDETLNMFGIPRQRYLSRKEITGDKESGIPPIIDVSKSTWLGWVRTGYAPDKVKLSEGTTVWRTLDIVEFLQKREQESRSKK